MNMKDNLPTFDCYMVMQSYHCEFQEAGIGGAVVPYCAA